VTSTDTSLDNRPSKSPSIGRADLRPQDHSDVVDFRSHLIASGRSPKTTETYIESANAFASFTAANGMPLLPEVRREHVESWLGWLRERGNKSATVRNRYSGVRALFRWMVEYDIRRDHPMERISPPALPDQVQPDYGPEQVAARRRVPSARKPPP
jgi:site-specific recombinase XerD